MNNLENINSCNIVRNNDQINLSTAEKENDHQLINKISNTSEQIYSSINEQMQNIEEVNLENKIISISPGNKQFLSANSIPTKWEKGDVIELHVRKGNYFLNNLSTNQSLLGKLIK